MGNEFNFTEFLEKTIEQDRNAKSKTINKDLNKLLDDKKEEKKEKKK